MSSMNKINFDQIKNLVIITGFIGKINPSKFRVNQAPFAHGKKCLFFGNDINAKHFAICKAWQFVHLPHIPLRHDIVYNSVQSKKLKFLQDESLKKYLSQRHPERNKIIWVDHKRTLLSKHVLQMIQVLSSSAGYGILIRTTPANKTSVWQEFREANMQTRYNKFARPTEQYILSQIAKPGISPSGRVTNTGLILYDLNNEQTKRLLNAVYGCVKKIGNPMCQIFWMIEAQKFPGLVKIVPYKMFDI